MDNEYIKTQAAGLNALSSANKAKSQLLSQANKGTTSAGHVYSKMKEIVGYNKRPKSTLHALLDGLFTGFEIHEKGKHYQTLQKGVDFLTRQQEAVNKDLLMEAQEQEKKQMISPYADSAYNITQSGLSPEQQHQSFTKLVNQVVTAGLLPQGSAFVATAGPNGFLFTPPGAESPEYFNYGKYISKDAQAFVKQNFDQGIQQQNAEAHMMSADASNMRAKDQHTLLPTIKANGEANVKRTNYYTDPERIERETKIKANRPYAVKLQETLHTDDRVINDMTEMVKVIKEAKTAGSSLAAAVIRFFSKATGQNYSVDKIGMLTQTQLHEMKEIFKGATSNTDVDNFMKTLPTLDKDPEAALEQLDKLLTISRNKANLGRQKLELYKLDNAANLFGDTANITQPNSVPHQHGTQEKMYTVETPDGEKRMIPENMIDKAIAQGGKVFG